MSMSMSNVYIYIYIYIYVYVYVYVLSQEHVSGQSAWQNSRVGSVARIPWDRMTTNVFLVLSHAILLFMAHWVCVHYYKMWASDVQAITGIVKLKIILWQGRRLLPHSKIICKWWSLCLLWCLGACDDTHWYVMMHVMMHIVTSGCQW